MDEDEAGRERLVEIAAKAHRRSVALNLALARRRLYSTDSPTLGELIEMTSAESACVAADKALEDWRDGQAR
jgi:hypothetical protein